MLNLLNTLYMNAIRSAMDAFLPSLRSTYDTVHCLGERVVSFSSLRTVFLDFLHQMHHSLLRVFPIQFSHRLLYHGHQKIRTPGLFRPTVTFWSPWLVSSFAVLLLFHPTWHTAWKNSLYFAYTAPNFALNHQELNLCFFTKLLAKAVATTIRDLAYPNNCAKYDLFDLMISLRCELSPELPLCGYSKQFYVFFFQFFDVTTTFEQPDRTASFMSVQPRLGSAKQWEMIGPDRGNSLLEFSGYFWRVILFLLVTWSYFINVRIFCFSTVTKRGITVNLSSNYDNFCLKVGTDWSCYRYFIGFANYSQSCLKSC